MGMSVWDCCVEEALAKLGLLQLLRSLRPITPSLEKLNPEASIEAKKDDELKVFDEMQPWDRASVEVEIAESTVQKWLLDIPSSGDEIVTEGGAIKCLVEHPHQFKKLVLFSGNDYLGLSSHPTIGRAAAKAALEHRMGPRGSALICGYTFHHRLLESSLAKLKKKEDCLLCPTGFAANMALMVAIGNIGSLLTEGKASFDDQKIAIFSDSLNHASIIDGIRLAERQRNVKLFIYTHCDMAHLNDLLSSCTLTKKVVVTDSLFSMDGDFAPMKELAMLRKKHGFLLVIDDAHGTFVCGKNGGGVAEMFNCERDVDICVGTLSKAAGCFGGFIACSKRWKLLIQSRGRSFIFSTAAPIPLIAAGHAAVLVAKKEMWRRREIWNRVQDFRDLTGIPIQSPIISLIVGSEGKALKASRHLLKSGFHVTAIRPPTVPANSCRLRVTLSATHTTEDVKKLTSALLQCIRFQDIAINGNSNRFARL
ncbi:8-amino-7-oxononanoate synthase isoform X2 [Cucumis melo var. makuwa]|uniref:8-amino-7-oxononanoate synthase isoform X2 n=2 Tax=Cucumis melo TaxID=3656 RepID=A0A1S3ATV3_CUCME|nr:8-amino-7-oxononanoate synthase isoform X2 [Cucumis melo]KAA0042611.1 8-amino-7-oxononanoate synthase isoform X2 [Cucumis melo var. makuwa]TYK06013.1 8-amino-7-oxononanoate synthase isoform X2 [Cucumis melo var. makuwa]